MTRTTASGWKWLLRWGMICAGVLGITAAAWTWWRAECNRRAAALIAGIEAHGPVPQWKDPTDEGVPDELNAATHYRAAWAAMAAAQPTPPASQTLGWQAFAEKEVAANPQALALLRKARQFSRICWQPSVPGATSPNVPRFTNAIPSTRLLQSAMIFHHQRQEDQKAIECWRDIEHQSRIIGDSNRFLITGLISMIESRIATEAMLAIAPDLQFDKPGQVNRATARNLIREVLDANIPRDAVARGYRSEPVSVLSNIQVELDRCPWLLRPGFRLAFTSRAANMDNQARAYQELRPPATLRLYCTEEPLLGCMTPKLSTLPPEIIQVLLKRRFAAMTIALRLYQYEQGRYPDHLDQLVPEYLPEIPKDSRNQDKTTLGYLLTEDGHRPLLYSAGGTSDEAEISRAVPKKRASLVGSSTPLPNGILWQDASNWGSTAPTSQPAGQR